MQKKTIQFAKCNQALKALTPILKNWCFLHEFYAQNQHPDAGYWYNERASISILAAAAWQEENWVALEEYSTRKVASSKEHGFDGGRIERSGRCDLFIGSKSGDAQFAIEAKQCWQPIGKRVDNDMSYLEKLKKRAWKDAGHLQLNEANKRLAVVFFTPSISVRTLATHEQNDEPLELLIERWCRKLETMLSDREIDGLAYTFPVVNRHLKGGDGMRLYPGTALIINHRLRAKKSGN
jgi:hypothetical protein